MTDKIISQERRDEIVQLFQQDKQKRQRLFDELAPAFPNDENGERRTEFLFRVGLIDDGLLQPASMVDCFTPDFLNTVTGGLETAGLLYLVEEVVVPEGTRVPSNLTALLPKYENLRKLLVPTYADLDAIRLTLKSMATTCKRQISLVTIKDSWPQTPEIIQGDNA